LRALLDAAKLHNQPGRFVSAECNLDDIDDKSPLTPGEIRQLPFSGVDFKQAFHEVRFGEPSPVMMQMLTWIVDSIQRVVATTDMQVGDAKNTGPVGTTVALIEQGSALPSAVHTRLHRALRREMRLLSQVIYENIPDDAEYPFPVDETGATWPIRPDFDGRVDVEPVSDPRIFSKTQRLALAQAIVQGAQSAPQIHDQREAYVRLYEALEVDRIDELLPPPEQPQRMDAVSENLAMLYGKAVAVFPDQDHKAHATIHAAVKTDPRFIALFETIPPEMQAQVQARMVEHEAQHLAWDYKIGVMGQIGLMTGVSPEMIPGLPDVPEFAAPVDSEQQPMHPPEVERQLDQMAAAAVAVQQEQQRQLMMAAQMAEMAAMAENGGGQPPQRVQ
jgi:hypothetical protein